MGHEREGRPPEGTRGGQRVCLCAALILLTACTGSSSKNIDESSGLVLSGSIGDGPIVDAEIRVEDSQGNQVLMASSDAAAEYRIEIPDGTRMPVILRVSGGMDLVTGRGADFELIAAAFDSGDVTLNATPYTTLAVQTARCMGELSRENVRTAWEVIHRALNLGWDRNVLADPMVDTITESNVLTTLIASEALGEVVRRAAAALSATDSPLSTDEVIEMLACDLADGRFNGMGPGVDNRVAFTAYVTATAVRLEVIADTLQVDGQDAGPRMDDALLTVRPGTSQRVADLPPNPVLIEQAQDALGVMQVLDLPELTGFAMALEDAGPTTARTQIRPLFSASTSNLLASLPDQIALAEETLIDNLAARQAIPAVRPVISLAADDAAVLSGNSTRLSWASSDADVCLATGAWNGERPLSGSIQSPAVTAPSEFVLTCAGRGGVDTERAFVDLLPPADPDPDPDPDPPPPIPDPVPVVSISADRTSVINGGTAQLTWSAADATACTASGGWSGSRPLSGSLVVGPLTANSTYTLTCTGPGGSASNSVTVQVTAPPAQPPVVTLSLASASIEAGASTTLSWSAANATACTASGAWSGNRATSGNLSVSPATTSTYSLTCTGEGGSDSAAATLTVNVQPPTLSFSTSSATVNQGGSVTLTWTSTYTSSCAASGAWSGSRAASGSELVGPIDAASTFTLSCSGAGGNVVEMLTVSAIGPVSLSWAAPTENVDGTPLTDLAGYRIYYGSESRTYSDMEEIMEPASTGYTLNLASGDYYVAMTALDQQGNESAYSNEVRKSAP